MLNSLDLQAPGKISSVEYRYFQVINDTWSVCKFQRLVLISGDVGVLPKRLDQGGSHCLEANSMGKMIGA